MDLSQILFLLSAGLILVSALMVVTIKQMKHAAYFLVLSFFGVAVLYALLEANFFAVVQIMIYIGAIAILILFAVMLTSKEQESGKSLNRNWWQAALISIFMFVILLSILSSWKGFGMTADALPQASGDISAFGLSLVDFEGFVLPFEVSSILLLAALIGAIYLGSERKGGKK